MSETLTVSKKITCTQYELIEAKDFRRMVRDKGFPMRDFGPHTRLTIDWDKVVSVTETWDDRSLTYTLEWEERV